MNVNLATGARYRRRCRGRLRFHRRHRRSLEFGDTLTGSAAANTMAGLGGDDTIDAGDGEDFVQGGEGRDTITGGSGDDTLYGEGSTRPATTVRRTSTIWPGIAYLLDQQDTIHGGDGNNFIDGGASGRTRSRRIRRRFRSLAETAEDDIHRRGR
ncbi:MAG: hypothetical protein R3F11_18865 [Verrucomicrobiales bacterium]